MVIYLLDDILVLNKTREDEVLDGIKVREILESLGFMINFKKSIFTPVQVIEFLGFKIDYMTMKLYLPQEKVKKIIKMCQEVLKSDRVSVRKLSEVIGNLPASLQAVHQAPLHYRHLQMVKNQVLKKGQNYDALVFLSQAMKEDLKWWTNHLNESNGKNIVQLIDQKSIIIQTDASKLGWRAVCQDLRIWGTWSENESQYHINILELLAIIHAVKSFLKQKIKSSCANSNRQQNSNDLCEQNGRHSVQSLQSISVRPMGMVHTTGDSRHHQDSSSWEVRSLHISDFNEQNNRLQCRSFCKQVNTKLEQFISWLPDPEAIAHNALLHPWKGIKGYAFPPFCLIFA